MAARDTLACHCEGVARSNLQLLLLFSILLFGCRPATPPPSSADQTRIAPGPTTKATPAPAKPTTVSNEAKEIRNAQYQFGATDGFLIVQLTAGKFEQGTPGSDNFLSATLTDFAAVGDLNADGTEEVAVLVSENYGSTDTFVFLAVYSNVDGTWTFQASSMVDDRPQLNALSIEGSEIFLDAVIHRMDEAECCPTLRTTRHYRFTDNLLDMTDYVTFTPGGDPRVISIKAPVAGSEVFSSISLKGNATIAPFENNLTYRIYDVGGVELAVGAMAVTASDPGRPGTFDTVISLGNILSGAVIRIEVQDLSAEDGSLLAMDSVELVVK